MTFSSSTRCTANALSWPSFQCLYLVSVLREYIFHFAPQRCQVFCRRLARSTNLRQLCFVVSVLGVATLFALVMQSACTDVTGLLQWCQCCGTVHLTLKGAPLSPPCRAPQARSSQTGPGAGVSASPHRLCSSAGSFVLSYQQHGQCIKAHCVVLFLHIRWSPSLHTAYHQATWSSNSCWQCCLAPCDSAQDFLTTALFGSQYPRIFLRSAGADFAVCFRCCLSVWLCLAICVQLVASVRSQVRGHIRASGRPSLPCSGLAGHQQRAACQLEMWTLHVVAWCLAQQFP